MTKRTKVKLYTTLIWFVCTVLYAYDYVLTRVGSEQAEGYEKLWDWQLGFFLIARLPILLVVLAVLLFIEHAFLKKQESREEGKEGPPDLS